MILSDSRPQPCLKVCCIFGITTSKKLLTACIIFRALTLVLTSRWSCNFLFLWVKILTFLFFYVLVVFFNHFSTNVFVNFFKVFVTFLKVLHFLCTFWHLWVFFPHFWSFFRNFRHFFPTFFYHFFFSNAIKLNKTCKERCREAIHVISFENLVYKLSENGSNLTRGQQEG